MRKTGACHLFTRKRHHFFSLSFFLSPKENKDEPGGKKTAPADWLNRKADEELPEFVTCSSSESGCFFFLWREEKTHCRRMTEREFSFYRGQTLQSAGFVCAPNWVVCYYYIRAIERPVLGRTWAHLSLFSFSPRISRARPSISLAPANVPTMKHALLLLLLACDAAHMAYADTYARAGY